MDRVSGERTSTGEFEVHIAEVNCHSETERQVHTLVSDVSVLLAARPLIH